MKIEWNEDDKIRTCSFYDVDFKLSEYDKHIWLLKISKSITDDFPTDYLLNFTEDEYNWEDVINKANFVVNRFIEKRKEYF